jgi:hypothetical protein
VTAGQTLSEELRHAIQELRETFGTANVVVCPDPGGVWVRVDGIDLGSRWRSGATWLAFHIASTYPYADIYPLFIDGTCELADGGLPPAVTANATVPIVDGTCVQVSRKSNRWDPTRDTAVAKAIKVIDWLRSP